MGGQPLSAVRRAQPGASGSLPKLTRFVSGIVEVLLPPLLPLSRFCYLRASLLRIKTFPCIPR
jgi:hypothetical protein